MSPESPPPPQRKMIERNLLDRFQAAEETSTNPRKNATPEPSDFLKNLPPEIVDDILAYLPTHDKIDYRRVCRSFQWAIGSLCIKTEISQIFPGKSGSSMADLLKLCKRIRIA